MSHPLPSTSTPRARTLRRATAALTGALLASLLGGCLVRSDTLAPIVTIIDPPNGTTRTIENLQIRGFAMDDEGVAAIRVNGANLLESPFYTGERGKRLIEFRFQAQDPREGDASYRIEVEDVSGRISQQTYALRIDATRPTLELTVTPLPNGRLRVEGTARDNEEVRKILINGVELPFSPAPEYSFLEDDVEATPGGMVVVEDSAGNRTTQPLQ